MRLARLPAKLQLVTWLLVAPGIWAASESAPSSVPSLARLLARHSPVLVLHPAERFVPVPVDGFLADSDLQRLTAGGWEKVDEPLPTGGADRRLDQRVCSARDGIAAVECYATAQAMHTSLPTAYGAAFRTRTRIVLQYWLWYPYNAYSPTVPPGELWQVHEGDWESVSVVLDRRGVPLVVGYSQHSEGTRRDWASVPKQGSRPRVSAHTRTTSRPGRTASTLASSSRCSSRSSCRTGSGRSTTPAWVGPSGRGSCG